MEFQELDQKALDGLITRVEEAIEHGLALASDDLRLLLSAIQTLTMLQNKIEDQDITLAKLRKLVGMVTSSEKKKQRPTTPTNKKPKSTTNRRPKAKKPDYAIERHEMTPFKKGDSCPECVQGKLYKYDPLTFLRITAHAPFEGKKHIAERLRCNLCQLIVTAEVPESVKEDGPVDQMYGYSARSAMAIDKFFSGLAYYHQETKGFFSGVTLPASTIYDQCEALSESVTPVYREILKTAANSDLFLLDDTSHRILSQKPQEKPIRNGKGSRLRTGVYCSGLIAYTYDQHEVVIFEVSLGHAGELIDDVLKKRDADLPMPKVMSDALSANHVSQTKVEKGFCNAHARRDFVDSESKFPDEVTHVLDQYGKIWDNEKQVKVLDLSPEARLDYHKEHSLPVMNALKKWCEDKKAEETFEEHSCLGKAVAYFLRHFEFLIGFCKILGMPIDNNRTEETLKVMIRGRKSYMFFKTVAGATVANILTTLIMTAYRASENPFDYLTALQKYQFDQARRPKCWMPWNYKKRIAELQQENIANAA